ncbi:bifunctional diguanylate cyclase/phosphodiesterase [Pseudarthrobacter sp. Fe7]|nr:bifunctional diguanylate cyclase/phosphodiesterase [Pseudarthrobacter sp. Fe7]
MLEERGLRASSGAGLSGVGILFVDVDNFKAVNDTYGHRVGDAVLAEFARRLLGCARSTDSVVRLGGDEFAFLLVNVDAVTACAVAKQVLDSLRAPFQHDGHELNLGATIGLAMGEDVSEEDELSAVEVLLRHADAAMLRAKLEGKGRLGRIIARREPSRFAREAHIRRRLPHVLSDAALSLHYQPVRDLATDEDAGVEALLRWTDRDLGTIAPDEFIPVAEHTGEIHRIGAWVIDRACAQARSWIDAGTPRKIAVNVSPLQLATGTLIGDIRSAMMRHNVPARMLEIEITEGAAIVDVPGAAGQLRELIDSGLGVALDDYGAAYSSLSMLRSLPLTTVKIDRTLINEIDTDPYLATIVGELIHMFKALGLRATAEGVERPTQLAVLRGLDCDTAQGYLISRPKPAADFPAAATTAAQNNEGQTGTELPL